MSDWVKMGNEPPGGEAATTARQTLESELTLMTVDASAVVRRSALSDERLPADALRSFLDRPIFAEPFDGEHETLQNLLLDAMAFLDNPTVTEQMVISMITSELFELGDRTVLELLDDPRIAVMTRVASHAECPVEILEWAVSSDNSELRDAAAKNPKLNKRQVFSLLFSLRPGFSEGKNRQREIMLGLSSNPGVPQDLLLRLVPDLDIGAIKMLADKCEVSRQEECVLEVLERSPRRDDRRWAAMRIKNPQRLRDLSRDSTEEVRSAVAQNMETPAELISKLCRDASPVVRDWAADHPQATEVDQVYVALLPRPSGPVWQQ